MYGLSFCLLIGLANARCVLAEKSGQSIPIERMLTSAVTIKTRGFVEIDQLGDSVWGTASGSGFLVNREPCEIWTNYHVVSDAAVVEIHPYVGRRDGGYPARVSHADPRSDLAILHLDECPELEPVHFGDSEALRQGDTVFAVGNPSGRNPGTISRGIVSHPYRLPTGVLHFIQTDASVCTGSSGGGLFNDNGDLVAMNSAILVDTEGQNAGFAYATPINLLRKLMQRLRETPPSRLHVGLDEKLTRIEMKEARALGVPDEQAALLVFRKPDLPPSRGVIESRDVIYRMEGSPVATIAMFNWLLSQKNAGDLLEIQLLRAGQSKTVQLPVQSAPIPVRRPEAMRYEGDLGLRVADWSQEQDERAFFKSPVIVRVMNLGPAHLAGVSSNQHYLVRHDRVLSVTVLGEVRTITGVIEDKVHTPIRSVDQLNRVARRAAKDKRPLLLEVEGWLRQSMEVTDSTFTHQTTTYHLVEPRAFPH